MMEMFNSDGGNNPFYFCNAYREPLLKKNKFSQDIF